MNKKIILIIILLIAIVLSYTYEYNKQHNRSKSAQYGNMVNETITNVKQVNANYTSLEELPKDYTLDDAILSNCYVYISGREYNKEVYDNFVASVENKESAIARIARSSDEGDVIIIDLKYDGSKFVVTEDNTRDKYSDEEHRIIKSEEYNSMGQKKIENNNFWILYNSNEENDYFVISEIH